MKRKKVEAFSRASELLLCKVSQLSLVQLWADPQTKLSAKAIEEYRGLVERRCLGEPLAYLLGEKEFYGRSFFVTRDTLIPRPETEHLVDWIKESFGEDEAFSFYDVGCGSGVIAISVALERPKSKAFAVDLSEAALKVAKKNADFHGASVHWIHGDLLSKCNAPLDCVVANLPYIPSSQISGLQSELGFEPRAALDGGDDGLVYIEKLTGQAWSTLKPEGLYFLEFGSDQADRVRVILEQQGFKDITIKKDLAGCMRLSRAIR
ncbi:MAG: peptide chain release factor N(5)-glutamine methyltransferase [Bdellovibrionales bacterium]|nr:peptide chain release factor N(5)-glutamine methyltransferase [Bdellovibrionales bacterium]